MLVFEDNMVKSLLKLCGGAGSYEANSMALNSWLTKFGVNLAPLQDEMSRWADLLGYGLPDYASYMAMDAGRETPTDKMPGVCQFLSGEIWMRPNGDVIHEQCAWVSMTSSVHDVHGGERDMDPDWRGSTGIGSGRRFQG